MTITELVAFGQQHIVEIASSYFGVNMVSSAMPPAGPDSSTAYRWIYGILHGLSLNLRTAISAWAPQVMNIPGFQKAVAPDAEDLKASAQKASE